MAPYVNGISHVVNFDIATIPEDDVHRIGRTTLAAATGDAISLVSSEEVGFVRNIERLIGSPIPHLEFSHCVAISPISLRHRVSDSSCATLNPARAILR